MSEKLDAFATRADVILKKLEAGEGTAGAMLQDKQVYDDLYGRYFPILTDTTRTDHGNVGTDDRVWDGAGPAKTVTTTFTYDACGNITLQRGTDAATGSCRSRESRASR